jgi:glycosyltransferase involved in cell wall biosynthesis
MKNKLLIIHKGQFGTLTDSYKWCEYLRNKFYIDYICFDSGEKKFEFDGVNIIYISYRGSKLLRGIRYILRVLLFLLTYKGRIMVVYFPGCDIFKRIYKHKHMFLDIRTLAVSGSDVYNKKYNIKLKKVCELYDYVSIISEGQRKILDLDKSKSSILPLGSDIISNTNKNFNKMKLLYVGTFNNRNLEFTIRGFSKYIRDNNDLYSEYHIVGNGKGDILEHMKSIAYKECNLHNRIFFYGYIPHNELSHYFDLCNVGVSFIPITDYYDFQPPTKTYEYILSGLYTIATSTKSNQEIISERNGVLILDTSDAFADAIKTIHMKKDILNSEEIRTTLKNHTWKQIVNNNLLKILDR